MYDGQFTLTTLIAGATDTRGQFTLQLTTYGQLEAPPLRRSTALESDDRHSWVLENLLEVLPQEVSFGLSPVDHARNLERQRRWQAPQESIWCAFDAWATRLGLIDGARQYYQRLGCAVLLKSVIWRARVLEWNGQSHRRSCLVVHTSPRSCRSCHPWRSHTRDRSHSAASDQCQRGNPNRKYGTCRELIILDSCRIPLLVGKERLATSSLMSRRATHASGSRHTVHRAARLLTQSLHAQQIVSNSGGCAISFERLRATRCGCGRCAPREAPYVTPPQPHLSSETGGNPDTGAKSPIHRSLVLTPGCRQRNLELSLLSVGPTSPARPFDRPRLQGCERFDRSTTMQRRSVCEERTRTE